MVSDGASAWGSTKIESSRTTNLGDGGAPGSRGRGHMGYIRFGSNRGRDESSGSTVATAPPGYAGGRSSNSPRRDVDRHGGLRAPGTRLSQKGTRVAPQIFTEARDKDVGPDRRNVPLDERSVMSFTYLGVTLDGGPMEGAPVLEPIEHSVLEKPLDGRPMEGMSVLEPLEHSVLVMALDGGHMEGTPVLEPIEHSVRGKPLDGGPMEGMSVLEPLEHSVLVMASRRGCRIWNR